MGSQPRGTALSAPNADLHARASTGYCRAVRAASRSHSALLAARGFATAILPRSLTVPDGPAIEVRSLDPPVGLPVVLVWRRERNAPPTARAFIDYVHREMTAVPSV